jgi:hypothetical protein
MSGFENFSAVGRVDDIQELFINSKTGFTKRTFTITAGKGKAMHLDLHYQKTQQLDGIKRGDRVHVEFTIKGKSLQNGNKINNLIVEKITAL